MRALTVAWLAAGAVIAWGAIGLLANGPQAPAAAQEPPAAAVDAQPPETAGAADAEPAQAPDGDATADDADAPDGDAAEEPQEVVEVADGLYVLPRCGNATARVTPQGVVVAGGALAQHRTEIARLLATVTEQPVAYEVHTRRQDADDAGPPVAPGARRLTPARSEAAPEAAPEAAAGAPPSGIVFHDRVSVFLGPVEVRAHHVGGGPADGAAVVLFPDRSTVLAGRLVPEDAPVIDYARGGSSGAWIEALDALLAIPFDRAVPGAGPVLERSGVQAFRDRLVTLRTRVTQLVRRGVPKAEVADRLQTDDLGWPLDPDGALARSLPALWDEIAGDS